MSNKRWKKRDIAGALMLKSREGFAYCETGENKRFVVNGSPEEQETLCNEVLEILNSSA